METAIAEQQDTVAVVFATVSLPPLGAYWPSQGGTFEALMKGENGQPDYALILHETHADHDGWKEQTAWAADIEADGHKDFTLPSLRELNALRANAKAKFNDDWYWSNEPYGSEYAWYQRFLNGNQNCRHQGSTIRACAFRRFPIR